MAPKRNLLLNHHPESTSVSLVNAVQGAAARKESCKPFPTWVHGWMGSIFVQGDVCVLAINLARLAMGLLRSTRYITSLKQK